VVGKKGDNEHRAIIGNNVSLSLGTIIVGKVKIGDNVKTGPNTVIIKDVPSNCAVSGVPAVIIKYYE
jgi:serine O-acetyltransferase